jgi:hypothetical protein
VVGVGKGQLYGILCGGFCARGSVILYCVVRLERWQGDVILGGEFWATGRVMVYCVVKFEKGKRNDILCCDILVRAR